LRRQLQQEQILFVRRRAVLRQQAVVGHPEHAGGKQLLAIAVLGKGARLAHQPIDHVPIIHPLLVPAPQARQSFQQLLRVPNLQVLHMQSDFHHFADQPARHRVAVPFDMDQAALVHATGAPLARFQAPRWQRPQGRQIFKHALPPASIERLLDLVQKLAVRLPTRKIPAAAQHQRLVHRLLETPVTLFDVPVLVGVGGLNLLPAQAVMIQQGLITLRELFTLRQIVHRRAQPIGPVTLGHTSQLPQRILQPFAEALEALRKAQRERLPVRVGQHQVIDHVLKRLPLDRHAQLIHVREVGCCQPAWLMHLAEEHFLGRTRQSSPLPHFTLQRP
jgi:hypothetical protein